MINAWIFSILSITIVSLISLIGIITLPFKEKKLHAILLYLVAFSTGAMLGDVFIHLLPEAAEQGFTMQISMYTLAGIIVSFLIEKYVHMRHLHGKHDTKYRPAAIMSLIGDAIHNLIDGMIVGASYLVSPTVGVATTIAVILHEIPQEIGNFGVLLHGGFTKSRALFFNFLTALTAFGGLFLALAWNQSTNVTTFLIPFAAGNFIYIAGSDLIPELHEQEGLKKNFIQLIMLLVGIGVMFSLLALE